MTRARSVSRGAVPVALAVAWLAATSMGCAGKAIDSDAHDDGTGGNPAGGAAASGGSATGGSSAGGAPATGGVPAAGGASPGSGGVPELPERCGLPLEGGICNGYSEVYGYDVEQGRCVQFVYGLCGGNENRFDTLEECESVCDVRACDVDADCRLRNGLSCCEACGSTGSWVAINENANVGVGCELVECDPCVATPPSDLTARCIQGECAVQYDFLK